MTMKFVPRHTIGTEISKKTDTSKFVGEFLDASFPSGDDSAIEFKQVNVDDITPRCINKYRQSRIEQLANSIQNTNNRLIHPIVLVRASDLPAGHEVRKAIEEQGKTVDDYKYIIVSGERRFHAWLLLRAREQERIAGKLGIPNQFDTITANILTGTEALNETAYYADANNLARHLSPSECVWFIKDALSEVSTNEQKREALIRLNGGSDVGIDEDPAKAAKRFRIDVYCRALLEGELGVSEWSDGTIRNMATVAMNCADPVVDALLAGDFPLREAKSIASLPQDIQLELLDLFKSDRSAYDLRIEEIMIAKAAAKNRVTHGDTRRLLRVTVKRLRSDRDSLLKISSMLGPKQNYYETLAIEKLDAFLAEIEKIADNA